MEGEIFMSTNQIAKKIESLLEWEKIMEEAKAEAGALRDEIKQELLIRNTEELTVGQYIIRWTSVLSQRFDATAFKKVMPDIYKAYLKQVSSRRFTIA
jgi:predicted phage-related endonuclease